ncbi:MAG: hypothetical protein KDA69_13725 [Planctomycetaceae bacterium]|nr:hypothetical protein [Planctomycetaceae bacterium]MCA9045381.1 hypothetical protein [Planctomycetaceae bacterium]
MANSSTSLSELSTHATYHCPGEAVAVPRSVHLARMAAGYAACRNCEHRTETGNLVTVKLNSLLESEPREDSIITDEGVRGLYCNNITRQSVSKLAAAIALNFWEESNPHDPGTLRMRPGELAVDVRFRRQRRALGLNDKGPAPQVLAAEQPRLVVGHDDRTSSPDLVVGVVDALLKWGCHVIDVGRVSRPEFEFAVLRGSNSGGKQTMHGGVYVTGGVGPVNVNGLDVIDKAGWPWTRAADWESVEQRLSAELERPVRLAGEHESASVHADYMESLRPSWRGIKPLRMGVASACRVTRQVMTELATGAGLDVQFIAANGNVGGTLEPPDAVADALYELVDQEQLHLGFIVGNDGRSCYFMAESGEILLPEQTLSLLRFGAFPDVTTDYGGRYWLTPGSPQCDALRTLVRLLHSLGRSNVPLSHWTNSSSH